MKKILFIVILSLVFTHSQAYRLYVIKEGTIDGYYDQVWEEHFINDVNYLKCLGPGPTPCALAGPAPICLGGDNCALVTNTQANSLIDYATNQVLIGNGAGSITTSDGITVTWSSTSSGMYIEISKD